MAFTIGTLQPIGGQSRGGLSLTTAAPQMWSYKTQDAAAVVDTSGYFNAAQKLLYPGDLIYRLTVNGSNVVQTAGFHVVMTSAANVVDVADTLALTVTNTD